MNLKNTLVAICLLPWSVIYAQNSVSSPDATVHTFVEKMPEAGYDYLSYISKNVRYPDSALDHDIQGKVIVRFVINEDGSIGDCVVTKGVGYGLDEEALRLVRGMPSWKPGMQNGKPVKVYFTLPVVFNLLPGYGQKDTVIIYTAPDVMPRPAYDIYNYLDSHIHYPFNARKKHIEGTVIVKFIVNEDGVISDCMVIKSVCKDLDDEALRVIKSFPKWKSGMKNGNPVKVYFRLPINFTLGTFKEN